MAGYTLLQLTQAAEAELGLTQSTSVASSTALQDQQFFALANRLGDYLLHSAQWGGLTKELTISITPAIATTGNTTSGGFVITGIPSTAGITGTANYWVLSGDNVPVSTRLVSVDSATQVTVNSPATATASGASMTFAQDTYDFPADYSSSVSNTQWDRRNRWALRGPDTPQQWQWMKSGIVTTGPRRHYRQMDGKVLFWPPPQTSDVSVLMSQEYQSIYWAKSAAGVAQRRFGADTDTCNFPDEVMVLGLKYYFTQAKGFDYREHYRNFQAALIVNVGQDQGGGILDMTRRNYPTLISPANVQDYNFPAPGG